MDIQLGDILLMKKQHPCGNRKFRVTRTGIDIKVICLACGREVMVPRVKIEKSIKKIERPETDL